MSKGNSVYKGHVQIYLQGQNALIPIATCEDEMTYFIGSEKSKLLIRDFRKGPILAARCALEGQDGLQFADIFNQPAFAEISVTNKDDEPEKLEINLHPTNEPIENPVLWLGVLEEKRIPPYDIDWEFLRPLNKDQIAFAILAK